MGRKRKGTGHDLQYPATPDTARTIFGLAKNVKVKGTAGLENFTDLTLNINSVLRGLVYVQVRELQEKNPTLKQEDLLLHDFVTSVTEIIKLMDYSEYRDADLREDVRKEFPKLRSATMWLLEQNGKFEEDDGVDGFYSRFDYGDKDKELVVFKLSQRGIKTWCSQLDGNKFTVRYTNGSRLTDGEKHFHEYIATILQGEPEYLEDPEKEYILPLEFVKRILIPLEEPRFNKDYSYISRTVIVPAINHIAKYTDLSFKFRKKKGERPTKNLCFYDFHRDDTVRIVTSKQVIDVDVVAEKDVIEERKAPEGVESIESYFSAAADVLGFSIEESFELNHLLNGDREKLKAAHESYLSMLRAGIMLPNELDFIRNVAAKK